MVNRLSKLFNKNLLLRIFSSIWMILITAYPVYVNGLIFYVLLCVIGILMYIEWYNLTKANRIWVTLGIGYVFMPISSVYYIRNAPNGLQVLIWFALTIWISDTAAYFVGRIIGGKKLAPKISSNKTWAGMIGALGGAFIFSIIYKQYHSGSIWLIPLTILTALLGQLSDLFESRVKRKFGVKDSSNIIPGHGGILDRTDSFVFTAPLVAIIIIKFKIWFSL